MLWLRAIDGNCVLHSWYPSAMNGPFAELNETKFFVQSSKSQLFEILLNHRREHKVHRTIFIDFFIPNKFSVIAKNPELVHRRQPCPINKFWERMGWIPSTWQICYSLHVEILFLKLKLLNWIPVFKIFFCVSTIRLYYVLYPLACPKVRIVWLYIWWSWRPLSFRPQNALERKKKKILKMFVVIRKFCQNVCVDI